jgi:hypothetical protein
LAAIRSCSFEQQDHNRPHRTPYRLKPLAEHPWAWVPATVLLWVMWVWWRARRADISWKSGNPYPGLAAYDCDRSSVFFGRDAETSVIMSRLDRSGAAVCSSKTASSM